MRGQKGQNSTIIGYHKAIWGVKISELDFDPPWSERKFITKMITRKCW